MCGGDDVRYLCCCFLVRLMCLLTCVFKVGVDELRILGPLVFLSGLRKYTQMSISLYNTKHSEGRGISPFYAWHRYVDSCPFWLRPVARNGHAASRWCYLVVTRLRIQEQKRTLPLSMVTFDQIVLGSSPYSSASHWADVWRSSDSHFGKGG